MSSRIECGDASSKSEAGREVKDHRVFAKSSKISEKPSRILGDLGCSFGVSGRCGMSVKVSERSLVALSTSERERSQIRPYIPSHHVTFQEMFTNVCEFEQ